MKTRSMLSTFLTLLLTFTWCSATTTALGDSIQDSEQGDAIAPKTAKDTFDKVFKLMSQSGALESVTPEEWAEMKATYQPRAEAASTNGELRIVLTEMIRSLGKSHFDLIPKEAQVDYLMEEEEEVDSADASAEDTTEVEVSEPKPEHICLLYTSPSPRD